MYSLECRGSLIAYEKLGSGSPIVFAHCSSASRREWLFTARRMAKSHTCYLPDLMGYGESPSQFDPLGREVACRDTDIIKAFADDAGEPLHIVAHSYGAAVALQFALEHPDRVRSLFLVEPVSFHLLAAKGFEAEYREISELGRQICRYESAGDSHSAARHYMSFWIGRIRWMLAPRSFRTTVVQTMEKVAFEFSLIADIPSDPTLFRALDTRVTMVSGDRSPRPALAVVEILKDALPDCRHVVIPGAGHMSPFTHREEILALVKKHFRGGEIAHEALAEPKAGSISGQAGRVRV